MSDVVNESLSRERRGHLKGFMWAVGSEHIYLVQSDSL